LSILSEHKKTITSISWNPRNPDIFVSASHECKLIVWDISKERPVAIYENTKGIPTCIDWCLLHGESVSYISGKGPLFLWSYKGTDLSLSTVKETGGFGSEVTCFRWHHKKTEKVAFGHKDGSLTFCTLGKYNVCCFILSCLMWYWNMSVEYKSYHIHWKWVRYSNFYRKSIENGVKLKNKSLGRGVKEECKHMKLNTN
jgi:WD40 repeat protein